MQVEVQKWGNSAAVRLPASALKDAGFQLGQRLELRVEHGKLVIETAIESLDDLVACITAPNRHTLQMDGSPQGGEVW